MFYAAFLCIVRIRPLVSVHDFGGLLLFFLPSRLCQCTLSTLSSVFVGCNFEEGISVFVRHISVVTFLWVDVFVHVRKQRRPLVSFFKY